ncbi:MAG: Crp/Fnr family transcriptional regulator [Gaiellaceae bacterium]
MTAADPARDGLDALRPFGVRQTWPSGATLLHQGEQPRLLFVIEHGEVALWDESGPERRLVQIVHKGASVGDLPVLLEEPCLYTAIARGETATLGFSREQVHDLLELDPQICFLWLRLLSRRLAAGYPRLVSLAGRSAGERVARFLLDELREDEGKRIALTQSELASATGLSRQRVSHVLRALERLGLVERGHGALRVLDPERLRATLPR